MRIGGPDPLKICRTGQSMFWPPKDVAFFHSKLLLDDCKFHIIKDEKLLLKMEVEVKTNFSRRLSLEAVWWLDLTDRFPMSYYRCTWALPYQDTMELMRDRLSLFSLCRAVSGNKTTTYGIYCKWTIDKNRDGSIGGEAEGGKGGQLPTTCRQGRQTVSNAPILQT